MYKRNTSALRVWLARPDQQTKIFDVQILVQEPNSGELPARSSAFLREYFDVAETWLRLYEGLARFIVRKRSELAAQAASVAENPQPLVVDKVRSTAFFSNRTRVAFPMMCLSARDA